MTRSCYACLWFDAFLQGSLAADHEDFEAIIVVQVDVEGGDNQLGLVVLDVSQGGLDVLLVVVIKEGDRAREIFATKILVVFDQSPPIRQSRWWLSRRGNQYAYDWNTKPWVTPRTSL